MKNNQGLIPTTVTDKNGKITTVHKKPQSSTATTLLPSPSLPAHQVTSDMRRTVTDRISEVYDRSHQSGFDYRPFLAKIVQKYSDETMSAVGVALQNYGDLARGVSEHILNGESEHVIKNTLHYYQKTDSDSYWRTASEVRALGSYTAVNMYSDLTVVSEKTQQGCVALMAFTRLIDTLPTSPYLDYHEGDHYDIRVIKDDSLATLIAQRPDDTERIAEIVLQRGTTDGPTINGLLDGALPALAEGHL